MVGEGDSEEIAVLLLSKPFLCLSASKRAGSGDASSEPKKKKRKKPRKQTEKANAPQAKQAAPSTSKSSPAKQAVPNLNTSTPAELTAPNRSTSTPTGTAVSKTENGTTGERAQMADSQAKSV